MHKRTNIREKPFHCDQCPKSFSVAGDLNNLKKTINEYFVKSISFFCSDNCFVKNIRQMSCPKMLKSFICYSWRHNSSICKTIICYYLSMIIKRILQNFTRFYSDLFNTIAASWHLCECKCIKTIISKSFYVC